MSKREKIIEDVVRHELVRTDSGKLGWKDEASKRIANRLERRLFYPQKADADVLNRDGDSVKRDKRCAAWRRINLASRTERG